MDITSLLCIYFMDCRKKIALNNIFSLIFLGRITERSKLRVVAHILVDTFGPSGVKMFVNAFIKNDLHRYIYHS
jgi:hypothetical protein